MALLDHAKLLYNVPRNRLKAPLKGDIIPLERSGVMSPKTKEFTERINVFFKPEQLERIKIEADKLGISVSAYIRMVVLEAVNWK